MSVTITQHTGIARLAQAGLVAKGIVYVLLGLLAFMAAFELGGQSTSEADRTGVFSLLKDLPAGTSLLAMLAVGLVCYTIWRCIQAFRPASADRELSLRKRARYLFSALMYGSVALTGLRLLLYNRKGSGNGNQQLAHNLLHQSHGQWLLGIAALMMAGNGVYQLYYGLSEKYRKHVQGLDLASPVSELLLRAGKVGYLARGVVWLIVAWLLLRAALHANSSEAGNTAEAFRLVESSTAGSLLLGALGLGLVAYGVFNFIRARYERFY